MSPETRALVEVEDVVVEFKRHTAPFRARRALRAVDQVTLGIERGEVLGLVGESGSGKTTLGRAIVRLVKPQAGRIRFDGLEIAGVRESALRPVRRRMQIVFQDPYASLNPRMTAGALVREPLVVHRAGYRREVTERATDMLELVGLPPEMANRYPHQLSGGQRQRVAIARALVMSPELLVCDEAVSALDVSVQAQILNLLLRLRAQLDLTYLFISHDISVVAHLSSRVAVMYFGRILETGPVTMLYGGAAHPYTQSLLAAVPVPEPDRPSPRARIVVPEGSAPGAIADGCVFRSRCWLYKSLGEPAVCSSVTPLLDVVSDPDHQSACHFRDEGQKGNVGLVKLQSPVRLQERDRPPLGAEPSRLSDLSVESAKQGA